MGLQGRAITRIVFILIAGAVLIAGVFKWSRAASGHVEQAGQSSVAIEQQLRSLPQPYSRLLISMSKREPQLGIDGVAHALTPTTGVPIADGLYIYNLVRRVKPERTAEVGLAEGFSTLYFFAALQENGSGVHVAIDPFETADWHGIGIQKVKEAGINGRFRFIQAKSSEALPQLATEHRPYQIIFIDGDHRFDGSFVDFILSDAICSEGGYLLFHDTWMPSTKKLVSFIEQNRSEHARRPVPDGVNIAAFQKIGKDQRSWQHFVNF